MKNFKYIVEKIGSNLYSTYDLKNVAFNIYKTGT